MTKNKSSFLQNLPWILFTLTLFLLIPILVLVQKKMSGDGTLYASIAWNMAHNIGSLWHPVNAPSVFPQFYEHPSLGMFINSLFFRVFGDNFIVDRLYCLATMLLSLVAMILIWFQLQPSASRKLLWLPILCWVAVPLTTRAYGGNAVEDLLVVFTTFSVWAILHTLLRSEKIGVFSLLFASVCMTGAFFTNGLQAFFPIATPLIYAIVFHRSSWKVIFTQTSLLIFFTAAIIGAVLLHRPAFVFIQHYFDAQVLATFDHARVGNGNYQGIAHLMGILIIFGDLFPLLIVMSVMFAVFAKKAQQPFLRLIKEKISNKNIIFFLLVGLSASLPILASSRQESHYFLQAFPFYILMCVEMLTPIIVSWTTNTNIQTTAYKRITAAGVIFSIVAFIIVVSLYGRSPIVLQDVTMISKVVPNNSSILVRPKLFPNWNLHAYFYRYHRIDLTEKAGAPFYLQYKEDPYRPIGYQKVNLPLQHYVLYKMRIKMKT